MHCPRFGAHQASSWLDIQRNPSSPVLSSPVPQDATWGTACCRRLLRLLAILEPGEVGGDDSCIGMVGAVGGLEDSQRPLEVGAGAVQVA